MRSVIGLAAAGLASLALATIAHTAGAPHDAADPPVTISYSGTLDTSWEPVMRQPDGRNRQAAQYQWALTWRGHLSDLEKQPTQKLTVEVLKGTVQFTDRTSAEHADCSGSFVPRVKTITFTASVSQEKLVLNLRVPVSAEFLTATNTTSLNGFCGEVVRWALPGHEMVPIFKVDLDKGGTAGRDVTVGPLQPNRERAALEHSATVTVGGAASGVDVKATARRDLQRALERAKGPCLQLAISLGVMTTGAVWTSVAALVPGGIPAGAAVIATGAVMGSVTAPLCASVIEQIVTDYSIYKRDPPVSRAAPLVTLPSCAKWEGAVRTYCRQLGEAAKALVADEHRVVLVLARLQSAATKLAAARKAGDKGKVATAEARARTETAALGDARAAASAAGKRVATLVRSVGVRGTLTKAQSAATIDALLARLARRGVPASDLRAVAPAALRPKQTDVLVTLTR
jgi:hypothetical protein